MEHGIDYRELEQLLAPYKKLFDMIRIVDPIKKRVVTVEDNNLVSQNIPCYLLWDTDEACQNCIAGKALREGKTHVKIQYDMGKMHLIFATPIALGDKKVAVEMLKNVTDSLVFETVDREHGHEERNIINDLNSLLLKDALTGLYNRRYITQMLPIEIERNKERGSYLSVVMADIDCFKTVNDTYGHHAGDVVIKKVAGIMSQYIRHDTDWIARYGGDEILICLNKTNKERAHKIVERLREAIENAVIEVDDIEIEVTVSFGVCILGSNLIKDDDISIIDVIKCADDKLYEAKSQGRNRVVI